MDAGLTQKGGVLGKPRDLPYLGLAVGTDARAVLLTTSKPYDDGTDRPSVVYVKRDVADPEPAGTGGAQLQE
jgi:cytosine/adenosine deaminase-related metal-dependent hydrolase